MTGDPADAAQSDETMPTQHITAPSAVYPKAHEGAPANVASDLPTVPDMSGLLADLPTARIPVASAPRRSEYASDAEPTRIVPVTSAGQPPTPSTPPTPLTAAPQHPLRIGAVSASDLYDDMEQQPDPHGDTRGDLLPIFSLRDAEVMQQREWTGWQRAVGWVDNADRRKRKRTSTRRGIILAVAALLLIGVPLLLAVSLWPSLGINLSIFGGAGGDVTPATPAQWARDTQLTPYNTNDAAFASQQYPVDAAFQSYYTAHNGAALLGVALTPGFTVQQGRAQFFVGGALLVPTTNATTTNAGAVSDPGDITDALAHNGHSDTATQVIWLPLIQSLLTAGSEAQALPLLTTGPTGTGTPTAAPTITQSSVLTYVDLRQAATPGAFVTQPARGDNLNGAMFVAEGKRNGKPVGHLIPAALWTYLQSPTDAPDGWKTDIGEPLTEALPLTVTINGQTHHLLTQAFSQTALAYDEDNTNADDGPAITPLTLGESYLLTLGPPTVTATPNVKTWATGDTALLDAP
ncbi:MAG: hypothetical protein ABI068_06145, partial [Ktedonobacterales bacterium]